jgi:predicted dehydrogenase
MARRATGRIIRVGVIGVGRGQSFARGATDLVGMKLVAVCDTWEERLREVGKTFGVRTYTDYDRFLEHDMDAVILANNFHEHAPFAIQALRAGKHVLVEKPMAMNAKECELMIRTAKENKRKLMVAQHMRFEAQAEALKAVIERGDLGQIYTANAKYLRRRGIPGWGKFHIRKESLGGPLIDIGVHVMDLCVWLMGCPKPIAASGKVYRMFGDREDLCNADWGRPYPPKEFDVEDYAVAFVRFEKNITMLVECSWAANIAAEYGTVSILGDKGGVATEPLGVYSYKDNALTTRKFDWLPSQEGHRMEIHHFAECIEKNRPVRVQPIESLRIQKIIDAIYESSVKNREILIK